MESVYLELYNAMIHAVDANDNGVPRFDGTPKFRSETAVHGRVARLNLKRKPFKQAMAVAAMVFFEMLDNIIDVWLPG